MKTVISTWIALVFLGLLISCSDSKKDSQPVPVVVETGTITGTILPANSVTRVDATSSSGSVVSVVPNAATGVFTFTGLPLGSYTLSFVNLPSFDALPAYTGRLQAGALAWDVGKVYLNSSTGIITGTIFPANGVTRVDAINSNLSVVSVVPDATTGVFTFTGLPLNRYTIKLITRPSFDALPDAYVEEITASAPRWDVGNIYLRVESPLTGSMSWTLDGTSYTSTTVTGSILRTSSDGSMKAINLTGTSVNGAITDAFNLYVNNVSGTIGAYRLGVLPYPINPYGAPQFSSNGSYIRRNGTTTLLSFSFSYTNYLLGVGTLYVDTYDLTTRTLTGRFDFRGDRSGPGVTNGLFTLHY